MKNIFENFVIMLVGLFSLAIIGLIIRYTMISESSDEQFKHDYAQENKIVEEKREKKDYLKAPKGYKDADKSINQSIDDGLNKVVVRSEEKKDKLGDVLKEKKSSSSIGDMLDNLLN